MRHPVRTAAVLIITLVFLCGGCLADTPVISVSSAAELADCVAGLTGDCTVRLLADIEETVTVSNDRDITVTIDGNNHTLRNGLNIDSHGNCSYVLTALNISPMDKDTDEYASTCLHVFNCKGQNEVVLMDSVSFPDNPEIAIQWHDSYGNGTLRIENTIHAQAVGIYIDQDIDESNSSHVTVCGHGEISVEGTAPVSCAGFTDVQQQIRDQVCSVSVRDLSLKGGKYTVSARMTFQRMKLSVTDIHTDKPVSIFWEENYVIDARDTDYQAVKDGLSEWISCTAGNHPCEAEIRYSGDTNDTSEDSTGIFTLNR